MAGDRYGGFPGHEERERMMGLEPTTFCMASVLWFGSRRAAMAHG